MGMLWGLNQASKPHPPGTRKHKATGHHSYACVHAHAQALTLTDAHSCYTDLHACPLLSPTPLRIKTAPAWGGFQTRQTPEILPAPARHSHQCVCFSSAGLKASPAKRYPCPAPLLRPLRSELRTVGPPVGRSPLIDHQ